MPISLSLDFETASEIDLKKVGLDVYSKHPSTRVLMCAWAFDNDEPQLWLPEHGPFPQHLIDAIQDPLVEVWSFNCLFERAILRNVLKIKTPVKGWRDTMVLAYMQSFAGTLDMIGRQVELPQDKQKLTEGSRLIQKFCKPQRVTKNQPYLWRDEYTDPEDWELFCEYCKQDVVAERGIKKRLIKFPILASEWELFEYDILTNERGFPVDMLFVENAIRMATMRKAELTEELRELTGLANPNSPKQIMGWLQQHGYPFSDLRKDTVLKVIGENSDHTYTGDNGPKWGGSLCDMTKDGFRGLLLRQVSARTSVRKFNKIKESAHGGRFRNGFQFAGASRTNRAAGRGLNPQNLTRTPKLLEPDAKYFEAHGAPGDVMLEAVTEAIRNNDYDLLNLLHKEPMNTLAGTVRSAIRAPEGQEFVTADLSSIETCVLAWVSGCERLLGVIRKGQDPYKDFGTELYNKAYADITKFERQMSKPAVLGAGFRLGGGKLIEGKRTGLWAYAESLGVNMTQAESTRAVKVYRETYPEVPQLWYALENAVARAIRSGRPTQPIIKYQGRKFVVPIVMEMKKPYLTIKLPSGRLMYYHKPRITVVEKETEDGRTYTKEEFSYMGMQQGKRVWKRIESHGGKITENIVQAIARDILMVGYLRAAKAGFKIVMHVHDELVALVKKGENFFTLQLLIDMMTLDMEDDYPGLPLRAEGQTFDFYRK